MSQINKPSEYFNTLLYTATGVQSVTGAGFQPDMSWVKARSTTSSHYIADVVRGSTKTIKPNSTDAEGTQDLITSFDSDGVTLGSSNWSDSRTAVIWNWLAGGTASSNTDGSITSSVSANTTSGFSIVSYTGTGANATVGHGLGVAPKMVIFKNRDNGTQEWDTYHAGLTDATYFIQLNSTNAQNNTNGAVRFNSTAPTSSATGGDWIINDNKRNTFNVVDKYLFADQSAAEGTADILDFLSTGFKFRRGDSTTNSSGATYIYMAFAENPLVGTNNIPATAR